LQAVARRGAPACVERIGTDARRYDHRRAASRRRPRYGGKKGERLGSAQCMCSAVTRSGLR
jgi:hypothetical protein